MKIYRLLLVVLFSCISPLTAFAVQVATITSDQASIRDQPDSNGKILEIKKINTQIKISSQTKNGWYKTQASSGQYGWIAATDIKPFQNRNDPNQTLLESVDKTHEHRSNRSDPIVFLKGGLGLFGLFSGNPSERLGVGKNHLYLTLNKFAELAVRIEERLKIAMRIAHYSHTSSVSYTDPNTGNKTAYTLNFSGVPLLAGLQADITQHEAWDMNVGIFAGLGLANNFTVTTDQPAPNTATLKETTYAFLVHFTSQYWFTRHFGIFGEVAAYYSKVSGKFSSPYNGDAPFRVNGSTEFADLTINHIGPLFQAGFSFAF